MCRPSADQGVGGSSPSGCTIYKLHKNRHLGEPKGLLSVPVFLGALGLGAILVPCIVSKTPPAGSPPPGFTFGIARPLLMTSDYDPRVNWLEGRGHPHGQR